ncbi:hypothetical protein NBRC111894_544 [Sporolactobacillus inulinus]|uniref:Uncharacterized protein n=1 Tax=Sporolactobacillus inulinus TaxID=2078 RepID=A0A4Y1Z7J3_9BACL|nr:hypothetical protein NBRC111894_544 [Sporolactobacillus inulinus]
MRTRYEYTQKTNCRKIKYIHKLVESIYNQYNVVKLGIDMIIKMHE